jgi:hypothetical protein
MSSGRPPQTVEIAFWCWLLAAALMVIGGLMAVMTGAQDMPDKFPGASLSEDEARSLVAVYRGAGVLFVACGLGVGYFGFRIRTRRERFRRLAVGLSFAILLLVVMLGLMGGILMPLTIFTLIALIGASTWFKAASRRDDG